MRFSTVGSVFLLTLGFAAAGRAAEGPQVLDLWPGKVPGETGPAHAEKITGTKPNRTITDVTRPTLTIFRPAKSKDTGSAVIIAPGGGYRLLAWDKEGEEVAAWLNRLGVTGIVLKYRVPRRQEHRTGPLQDAQRAISLVRSKAREWGIKPDRIGMLGFSAGGHLTAWAATNFDKRAYELVDEADKVSCRPDFTVIVYPGGVVDRAREKLAPEIRVSPETPPTFLTQANDDPVGPQNSAVLYLALKKAGVPAALHIYATGGHGYGLRPSKKLASDWPRRCEAWLRNLGILRPTAREPQATAAKTLKIAQGFQVELLYSVPKEEQGSWINLCVDPEGRLITSDQYGPLYRITPPALGAGAKGTKVEKLPLPLGGAHGLVWAFDSLYVIVNEAVEIDGVKPRQGLHRVRSKDGGDTFEKPEFLRALHGSGEHGIHAVLPGPDGKSLYVVVGDATRLVSPLTRSRVPRIWGEDHLLPRLPDGNGFMANVLGPGGCIYKVSPDGKDWELVSTGYRNPFDAAFNREGELFTYDADMEWDMNTPWYRPTRVCLATSGSEFGWRNGAGKWPPYYPDSLPAIYNVGPGSPTGMTFGYGARFPAKYQEALFMCDWSYGKLYALHLKPQGSAYTGELEEFLSGSPLPLTDVVVNPKDGALYFTIGGRKTQSGLYRVTYVGRESTAPAKADATKGAEARALRHRLEAFHVHPDPRAVDEAWPYLSHPDRYIRFAARVAIEHQDPKTWQERALKETDPARAINALLALVRVTGQDPFHHPRKPGDPVPGAALKGPILDALGRIAWRPLTEAQRLDLLRVYAILLNRMGWPDRTERARLIQRFDPCYPAGSRDLNAELCQLLVYLETPGVAAKTLKLLAAAPSQEEQLEYGRDLRCLQTGWTPAQRNEYFAWYLRAAHFKGGASLQGFLRLMKRDALATLTENEKEELRPVLAAESPAATPVVGKPRPFYRHWKLNELVPLVEKGLVHRDFERGRRLFGEAQCFACHRFDNQGGAQGPDLTGAAGRFSVRDLLESILEPSKEISDQYAAVIITTTEGKVITGRVVNYQGDHMAVMTNMLDPNGLVNVNVKEVESVQRSNVSMMPEGLLDSFKEDEILDLVAYLLSRGDRSQRMFAKR